ncbi:hypothetical protein SAMN05518801_10765 [Novosphingobium sp. CF614]|uniref:hypothetical protein n=1 Tax=Novosphingobium sp. CF614 TaxID=1884364 RepID=UPI0008E45DBA|nr:hypothetical protein [Novosphingobium sp. CF614]SFG08964.1 hypothetical protein SAMN05518801_10765 [Novosphingobium sp. CF614]
MPDKSPTIVTHLPERCDCCGLPWRILFTAFVNGAGWRRLCGHCSDPDRGAPRAYLGPYPITSHPAKKPRLHIVGGAGTR